MVYTKHQVSYIVFHSYGGLRSPIMVRRVMLRLPTHWSLWLELCAVSIILCRKRVGPAFW